MERVFAAVVKGKVVINRSQFHKHLLLLLQLPLKSVYCFHSQYSEKEDKYEEEIKILSDKLKEVSLSIPNLYFGIVCLTASYYSI